jgi:2,4-dienoyl-CoA reductase-like NADH-dependent reductase (Old Yellow Enzyme family)
MGQVRHGSATTTHVVRAAIQRSQASLSALSREFGINPKTVAKWRKRATVEDLKTGPKAPHSTTLSEAEEAAVGLSGISCASGRLNIMPPWL